MNYIAIIHKDKNSSYGASFPEVGGYTAASDTLDGVIDEATEALSLHLETLSDMGKPYPEPKGFDYALKNSARKGFVTAAIIPAIVSDNTVRVNITIPERHLQRIDLAAKKRKMSRSAFLTAMALQAIEE